MYSNRYVAYMLTCADADILLISLTPPGLTHFWN